MRHLKVDGGRGDRVRRSLLATLLAAVAFRWVLPARAVIEMTGDQQMTGEVAKKLVGAWRYVGTTINGVNKPRGNNPKGIIYYGPHGEMSVQIAPDVARKRAGAAMTAEEAKIAVTDYIAYFGSYTIDEKAGTVTHHRQASIQPGDSGDLERKYEFVGDRLILRSPNSKLEITWERIR